MKKCLGFIGRLKETLPSYTGDLAQEITKDPYNFDFVTVNRDYNERELKDALTEKRLLSMVIIICLRIRRAKDMFECISDYKTASRFATEFSV